MSETRGLSLGAALKQIAQRMADRLTAIGNVEDLHVLINHGRGARRELEELQRLYSQFGGDAINNPVAATGFSRDIESALDQASLALGRAATFEEIRERLTIALILGTEVANDLRGQVHSSP
jgi:UDP-N-acetylglucosamine:LPS N-acetylglucosamine transferase